MRDALCVWKVHGWECLCSTKDYTALLNRKDIRISTYACIRAYVNNIVPDIEKYPCWWHLCSTLKIRHKGSLATTKKRDKTIHLAEDRKWVQKIAKQGQILQEQRKYKKALQRRGPRKIAHWFAHTIYNTIRSGESHSDTISYDQKRRISF